MKEKKMDRMEVRGRANLKDALNVNVRVDEMQFRQM